MEWLFFLNLEYWYCVIISLFGQECAIHSLSVSGDLGAVSLEEGDGVPGERGSFFSNFFSGGEGEGGGESGASGFFSTAGGYLFSAVSFAWGIYSGVMWIVSGLLFFLALSAILGIVFIRAREIALFRTVSPEEKRYNPRREVWNRLLDEVKSTDPKLWKGAILEADVLLGELLWSLGYTGRGTAEKMRALPEEAFVTVPVAWEAHRIRNFVADSASDFILTQREAFRVMKLYEQVFEEFDFI